MEGRRPRRPGDSGDAVPPGGGPPSPAARGQRGRCPSRTSIGLAFDTSGSLFPCLINPEKDRRIIRRLSIKTALSFCL
jgi:hypothetical protein